MESTAAIAVDASRSVTDPGTPIGDSHYVTLRVCPARKCVGLFVQTYKQKVTMKTRSTFSFDRIGGLGISMLGAAGARAPARQTPSQALGLQESASQI
jgi:hypothetical protein